MKKAHAIAGLLMLATGSTTALANDVAAGLFLGTTGIGAEGVFSLNDSFNLRLNVSGLTYSGDWTEADIRYDGDVDILNVGLLGDFYPFGNGFHLTVGAVYNGNEVKANAKSTAAGTVNVNGVDYSLENESLKADVGWRNFAPYAGIGWNAPLNRENNLFFTANLGVMFTGSPDARLKASEGLREIPGFEANLRAEQDKLNNDIDDINLWPVARIGILYQF